MSRSRLVQVVAVLMGGLFVYLASGLTDHINAGREEMNMIGPESVLENTPPEYAFVIQAFGAFRGLITDIAFIRAEEYKEQGRYYDAMQLATWIAKLQPRFPSVWEFLSWNMAWNISVTTYTPEERWNWVYNGVKLIRDEALRYNPRAINLYKQLAWMFNNKMGEGIDEFHRDYKRNWAWRMHLVLGAPPDPVGSYSPDEKFQRALGYIGKDDKLLEAVRAESERRDEFERIREQETGEKPFLPWDRTPAQRAVEEARQQQEEAEGPTPYEIIKKARYDFFKDLAAAPQTLDELYEETPETRELVSQLRELDIDISDETLDENNYWNEDGLAFSFFTPYRRLSDPLSVVARIARGGDVESDLAELERFDAVVGVREQRPAGQALLRFLQRKVLTEVYKLEVDHMAFLMETFGPIDWRVVDSQSLYWVSQAIIKGKETISSFKNDKTNTLRIIFFSLRNLYLRNKVTFQPYYTNIPRSYINLTPDPYFVEPLHQAYIIYGRMIDPDPGPRGGAGETFRAGHINFLTEAIRMLYFSNHKREAREYFEYLRATYYTNDMGQVNKLFDKSLDDFAWDSYYESADSIREAATIVNARLMWAYEALSDGDYGGYNLRVQLARRLHGEYMADKWEQEGDRRRMPDFAEMQVDAFRNFLLMPSVSEPHTIIKAQTWGVAPLYLQQSTYDDLIGLFAKECDWWSYDVTKAFPEPPDMDEFRKLHKRVAPKTRDDEVETPAQSLGG